MGMRAPKPRKEASEFIEKVLDITRVAKVVKGGRRFSIRVLAVIGDGKGMIGMGFGKSNEVMAAIQKAIGDAKRHMVTIPRRGTTIPHEVTGRFKAARVLMRPASEGTGVIAGGVVRAIAECAGIQNILSKSLGSDSKINIARAAIRGLESMRTIEQVAALRNKSIEELKAR